MLRWNSGTLLALTMVLIISMDHRIGSTSLAQSANVQNQLTRERYLELLAQNSLLAQRQVRVPARLAQPLPNQSSTALSHVNGYSTAAPPTAMPVSQAHLPPIVQPSELQNMRIPSWYSDQGGQVAHATILNVQPASDPMGQADHQQGNLNNMDQQQANPFADPPGSYPSTQDPQDPFADPPENVIPPDQQNPFADPPEDMDPSRFQDPFSMPQNQPDVDPFANAPQDIVPPNEFLVPNDTTVDDGMDSPPNTAQPEPPASNPGNADVSGPFKSRGFAPTPIQPAPPNRDLDFLNPPFVPGAGDTFFPNMDHAQEWNSQLDQPTLIEATNNGFQKRGLYEGMSLSYEDNNFAAYECASCNREPHLPGKHFFNRMRCHMAGQYPSTHSCCISGCDSCSDCSVAWNSSTYYPEEYDSCFELAAGNCCEPMFYFAVFGGYVQLEDTRPFEAVNTIGITSPDSALSFNDGFGIGVAIGQIQGENLRTEIEFAFRDNNVSELIPDQPTLISSVPDLDGSIESFSGMLNFIWDFRAHPRLCGVRPYAGGGVGFSVVESTLTTGGNSIVVDSYGNDSSFAWQLLAGLSRPLTARMDGFVEYRYFKAESIRLNINVPATLAGDVEYETDNVFFGLRMYF